jgi:hypothetical protein
MSKKSLLQFLSQPFLVLGALVFLDMSHHRVAQRVRHGRSVLWAKEHRLARDFLDAAVRTAHDHVAPLVVSLVAPLALVRLVTPSALAIATAQVVRLSLAAPALRQAVATLPISLVVVNALGLETVLGHGVFASGSARPVSWYGLVARFALVAVLAVGASVATVDARNQLV